MPPEGARRPVNAAGGPGLFRKGKRPRAATGWTGGTTLLWNIGEILTLGKVYCNQIKNIPTLLASWWGDSHKSTLNYRPHEKASWNYEEQRQTTSSNPISKKSNGFFNVRCFSDYLPDNDVFVYGYVAPKPTDNDSTTHSWGDCLGVPLFVSLFSRELVN